MILPYSQWLLVDKSTAALFDEISRILIVVSSLRQAMHTAANSNNTQTAAAALARLLKAAVKELQHQSSELLQESPVSRKEPHQKEFKRVICRVSFSHPQRESIACTHGPRWIQTQ